MMPRRRGTHFKPASIVISIASYRRRNAFAMRRIITDDHDVSN